MSDRTRPFRRETRTHLLNEGQPVNQIIDADERIHYLRHDLTPEQMYWAGVAFGIHTAPEMAGFLKSSSPHRASTRRFFRDVPGESRTRRGWS